MPNAEDRLVLAEGHGGADGEATQKAGAIPERNAAEARLLEKEQPIVKVSTGMGG